MKRILPRLEGLSRRSRMTKENGPHPAQLDFIRRRETVHFLGPPGTGKSYLATALGVAAVKAGKSVYKTTLAELTDSLAKAERQGQLAEKIRFFARASRRSERSSRSASQKG